MSRNRLTGKAIITASSTALFLTLTVVSAGERGSFRPGRVLTDDQRLNDDTGTADQFAPSVAAHKYGHAVAVWQDDRNDGPDIYFQLFTHRGQPFGTLGNVKVNDADHPDLYYTSDVAMDGYGNFIVVWDGGPWGVSHVFGQWYLANGRPLGGNFQVDETDAELINWGVAAAGLDSGGAVVVWSDRRADAKGDLMMQRFGRAGLKLGSNAAVDPDIDERQKGGAVGADTRGNFTVVWEQGEIGLVMARRFDPEGRPLGNSFRVAPQSDLDDPACNNPAIAVSPNGAFAVFWMAHYQSGETQRQACLYDSTGQPVTGVFRVDEPGKFELSGELSAAAIADSHYLFAWSGRESGDWNIYARACDSMGMMDMESVPVNDRPGHQASPDMAVSRFGNALFVWCDERDTDRDVYGTHLGSDMPHTLTAGAGFDGLVPLSWEPPYGSTEHERYLVYRGEDMSVPPQLLGMVDAAAKPLPDRMLDFVDTTAENGRPYYYAVRVDEDDSNFNIAWPVSPVAGGHVLGSAWSRSEPTVDGTLSTGEWDDAAVHDISEPDRFGNVHLYLKNTERMLYLAVIDSNDAFLEPATVLGILIDADHNGHWPKAGPSNEGLIALGPAGAVFWGYWGSYPDHLGGDALKTVSSVSHAIAAGSGGVVYEVAIDLTANPYPIHGGMTIGFSLWVTDPGNFYGYHYGNAGEWPPGSLWEAAETLGDLKLAVDSGLPDRSAGGAESFSLGQNYPNPFNPSTMIQFHVKEQCRVTLKVYDARGKEVAVLADKRYPAGNHAVRFDASGLPSGIYIYEIEMGDFRAARKMTMLE
jgi:hypothetical protein